MVHIYHQDRRAPVHVDQGSQDAVVALRTLNFLQSLQIGFGVHGPGCSAPARFLALSQYNAWIESATNVEEIEDEVSYRKTAFNTGTVALVTLLQL